jgi:nitrite reductase/ring-hydroxylating ferredoxin subunit
LIKSVVLKAMKKITYAILTLIFILSCSNDDTSNRNPYLADANFSFDINLNLPLYGSLSTPGSSIYIGNNNVGIKGVFVYNTGSGYLAWEASCPNHTPSSCSTMVIEGGTTCRCDCEDYLYSLANGSPLSDSEKKLHCLLFYRVDINGNVLVVSN